MMFDVNSANEKGRPNLLVISQSREKLASVPYFFTGMINPFFKSLKLNFNTCFCDSLSEAYDFIEKLDPDLILIDSGHDRFPNALPDAKKINEFRKKSALAFYTAMDAHCLRISENVKYLNELNPDVIFSHDFIDMTYPEHLAKKHIYVMNTYDDSIHRDYGLKKDIMCGFYGDGFFTRNAYPWRRRIAARVLPEFPSFHLPRPVGLRNHGIAGEEYARIVNRTNVVFGCGGIKDLPVRKLFEIPSSGAILMLPKTHNMEAIGFEHKQNCFFVDENNVLQSIRYLIDNPDEYERIRLNGMELVMNNHVWSCRDHVYRWYKLFRDLKSGQRVEQINMLNNLQVVPEGTPKKILSRSVIDAWLENASVSLKNNDIEKSLTVYEKVLSYLEYLPEAIYGLAICKVLISEEKDKRVERFFEIFADRVNFKDHVLPEFLYMYYQGVGRGRDLVSILHSKPDNTVFERLFI